MARKTAAGNGTIRKKTIKRNGKQYTYVMELLWKTKQAQDANRNKYGDLFQENDLVFTDELGNRVTPQALYRAFKLVVIELRMPTVRFHDLRHSYAVVSLKSGDDVKTVQENLGHATSAFTVDIKNPYEQLNKS